MKKVAIPAQAEQGQPWRRRLYVLVLAQALSGASFTMVFPFFTLFVQDLGVPDPGKAAFWAGVSTGAMALGTFLTGPLWGWMGDRYGRKPNLLRALVGAGIALILTALSRNIWEFVALRFLFGGLSGVFPAGVALAATTAPPNRVGYSVGMTQSAFYLGSTAGPLLGAALAGAFGYNASFVIAGAWLCLIAVLVHFVIVEDFQRSPEDIGPFRPLAMARDIARTVSEPQLARVLLLQLVLLAAPSLVNPVLPVYLHDLAPNTSATVSTGIAFGILSLASGLGALGFAQVSMHVSAYRVAIVATIVGAVMYLGVALAQQLWQVLVLIPIMGLVNGANQGATAWLVAQKSPKGKQSRAFGASVSVNALSTGVGPTIGGGVAAFAGLRWSFVCSAVAFATATTVAMGLGRPAKREAQAAADEKGSG